MARVFNISSPSVSLFIAFSFIATVIHTKIFFLLLLKVYTKLNFTSAYQSLCRCGNLRNILFVWRTEISLNIPPKVILYFFFIIMFLLYSVIHWKWICNLRFISLFGDYRFRDIYDSISLKNNAHCCNHILWKTVTIALSMRVYNNYSKGRDVSLWIRNAINYTNVCLKSQLRIKND